MGKEYNNKNLNYNFEDQKEPKKRMGEGDFANLPRDPKYLKFENEPQMRGGIPNSFTCDIEDISGIYENRRGE